MSTYATKDELNELTRYVKSCQDTVDTLGNTVATLDTLVDRINHVSTMKDTTITYLTEGDVLQYSSDGTWHNVRPGQLSESGPIDEAGVQQILRRDGAQLFLSKLEDDAANGVITFKNNITCEGNAVVNGYLNLQNALLLGNYTKGLSGAIINTDGSAEFDSIVVRNALTVPELNYNKITTTSGEIWHAVYSGVIESVNTDTCTASVKLEDGEYLNVQSDDICRAIFHFTDDNNQAEIEDSCGFPQYSCFTTIYFKVAQSAESSFEYVLKDGCDRHPQPGMTFVVYGNFTNASRQSSAYSTSTYTRYLKGVNDWAITSDNIASQFGKLDGLVVKGAPNEGKLTGNGAYLDNVYLTGAVIQFTPEQKEELKKEIGNSSTYTQLRCRGEYDSTKTYYYCLLSDIPDVGKEGYEDFQDSDRCYIRDYVYYQNQAYMVKNINESTTNKPTDTSVWAVASQLSFASINTLLAENAKLGDFNVSNNVFTSSNGKLSIDSTTGKVVAKAIEISGTSKISNIVISNPPIMLSDHTWANFKQISDDYYTVYDKDDPEKIVFSKVQGTVSSSGVSVKRYWVDPTINTHYIFLSQDPNQSEITVVLPHANTCLGTNIEIEYYSTYGGDEHPTQLKIIHDADSTAIDDGYDINKIKFLTQGFYKLQPIPTVNVYAGDTVHYRYVLTANQNNWVVTTAKAGTANEQTPLVFLCKYSPLADSFEIKAMDSLFAISDSFITITKEKYNTDSGNFRISYRVSTTIENSKDQNILLQNSYFDAIRYRKEYRISNTMYHVTACCENQNTDNFWFQLDLTKIPNTKLSDQTETEDFYFLLRVRNMSEITVPKNGQ